MYEVFDKLTGLVAMDETECYPVPFRGPKMYCAGVVEALGDGYGMRRAR